MWEEYITIDMNIELCCFADMQFWMDPWLVAVLARAMAVADIMRMVSSCLLVQTSTLTLLFVTEVSFHDVLLGAAFVDRGALLTVGHCTSGGSVVLV